MGVSDIIAAPADPHARLVLTLLLVIIPEFLLLRERYLQENQTSCVIIVANRSMHSLIAHIDWRKLPKSRTEPQHRQDKNKCLTPIFAFTDVQHTLVKRSWEVVLQPLPKRYDLWAISPGFAWELFRNAESQAPGQTY